jgi:two-component system chemotaxis response regulator CheY
VALPGLPAGVKGLIYENCVSDYIDPKEVFVAYSIMIVDDSETIRAVLERSLTMTKLPIDKVEQAANGRDAIEKLAECWIDIVFTDLHMPEMDGVELIDTIVAHPEYCDIPVVVISTEGSSTKITELQKKGIKGYLRKPFTPEKIKEVIINTLGDWNG